MKHELENILETTFKISSRRFIRDRHISECICITSEAINLLDKKSFRGNLALKIDIRKAFDNLDWDFLLLVLKTFGFNHVFCNWIKNILNSAKLSLIINGKVTGFFNVTRGVRQGDPLSPLLFCIAEEVLSRSISLLVDNGKLDCITGTRGMSLPSHAFFADDLMIFCKGSKKNALAVTSLFHEYAANSGRPKTVHLQSIADKIKAKLASWKGHLLSMMGRIQLVNSVIHGMLIYSFKIYSWPARFFSYNKPRASYIASSIWPGIKKAFLVINQYSIWKVGDGKQISFWKDKWLSACIGDVISETIDVGNLQTVMVEDIIVNGERRIPLIVQQFAPLLASEIMGLTIPSIPIPDALIWEESISGLMSFKDAYMNRSSISQPLPCLCNQAYETSQHLFFECPFALKWWNWLSSAIEFPLDISSPAALLSILEIIGDLINRFLIMFNSKIYFAMQFTCQHQTLKVNWIPPPNLWIKCNSDGASKGCPGLSACGGIFRDCRGTFVGGFSCNLGISNSLFAELTAAIMTIEIAHDRDGLIV
ncbi:hypothetical protein TSUD_409090 [Trifolium subterraneum]|uniref:Reverse transcriptase domain-containing protein n=1 Tax=Trifolium subterraneum TaxID=3900 RepID=A0A2Z6P6K7_TRISU|nr:hypothetical protein TSUD_409090 [Trifolium subterraneum]